MTEEHNSLRNIQQKKSLIAPQHKFASEEIIPDGKFTGEDNPIVGSNLLESILGNNGPDDEIMKSFKDVPEIPDENEQVENIYTTDDTDMREAAAPAQSEEEEHEAEEPAPPEPEYAPPLFHDEYTQPVRHMQPSGRHSLSLTFTEPLVIGFKNSKGAEYTCEFNNNTSADRGMVRVGLDNETSLEMESSPAGFNVVMTSQSAGKISVSSAKGPMAAKSGQYYNFKIFATDMTLQIYPGASFKTAGFSVSVTENSVNIVC